MPNDPKTNPKLKLIDKLDLNYRVNDGANDVGVLYRMSESSKAFASIDESTGIVTPVKPGTIQVDILDATTKVAIDTIFIEIESVAKADFRAQVEAGTIKHVRDFLKMANANVPTPPTPPVPTLSIVGEPQYIEGAWHYMVDITNYDFQINDQVYLYDVTASQAGTPVTVNADNITYRTYAFDVALAPGAAKQVKAAVIRGGQDSGFSTTISVPATGVAPAAPAVGRTAVFQNANANDSMNLAYYFDIVSISPEATPGTYPFRLEDQFGMVLAYWNGGTSQSINSWTTSDQYTLDNGSDAPDAGVLVLKTRGNTPMGGNITGNVVIS